ncbi:hypothetical protein YWS52_11830 [Chitiniphilus shinanonensis]
MQVPNNGKKKSGRAGAQSADTSQKGKTSPAESKHKSLLKVLGGLF